MLCEVGYIFRLVLFTVGLVLTVFAWSEEFYKCARYMTNN